MFQEEFITLPYNKYNFLINENIELKHKLQKIDNELSKEILQNANNNITIDTLETRIVYLENENKHLNERINQLEQDNAILKQENIVLKQENIVLKQEIVILKQEIVILKQDNAILKQDIIELKHNNIISKTIKVLQDINDEYKLETKIKNNKLARLRNQRNSECHYLLDDDNAVMKLKKIEYIINHLSSLDENIKTRIEKQFGKELIENIIKYIKPILADKLKNITEENTEEMNDELLWFWEY
jgi:transposase-like protein